MKTKEEIEILAEQWFENANTERWGGEELGFINGYSQCQEDMNKRIIELENTLHTICTWCNPHDSSHKNIWQVANSLLTK
jgi:hypothetical protein